MQTGTRVHLGTLLVRDGLLTAEQLEEALAEKEADGKRLGEIVVERGWVTGSAIARAFAQQHELSYLELREVELDVSAGRRTCPRNSHAATARCRSRSKATTCSWRCRNPTDVAASDDLRLAVGMPTRFAVVSVMDLEQAIGRAYRANLDIVEDVFDEEDAPDDEIEEVVESGAPAIKLVNQLISCALADGASDIHFEPQATQLVVRARIDGVTRKLADIPRSMQAAVTARLKVMGELDIAERRIPQDGRVSIRVQGKPMDLRIAVLPTTYGEQVVLRILHRSAGRRTLADLGMSPAAAEAFARAIRQPYGAVIACGPTGSGKTTTLYAALDMLNDEERVLTTIEDPVEYQIAGVTQVEVNTRGGLTFARGLRTLLRSDPDVLLIGEIRDEETARIAVQAAMTGHVVLTTLHTHNAASSIARLKNMGVDPELLATSINCIVAQRLARRLCPHCRVEHEATAEELAELGDFAAPGLVLFCPGGCAECAGVGYKGRVALYEVMEVRGRIRRLIEASTEEIFAAAVEQGMSTLRQDGIRLCLEGVSSLEEIRRVTGDRLI